jgi:5'-deoxynucleotidase YfbR-like HD superfamily hydrolase
MTIRTKTSRPAKVTTIPVIKKDIWVHTYPEEQGIGFKPMPHQDKNCPCGESDSLDFDPNHNVEEILPPKIERRWQDYDDKIGPDFAPITTPEIEESIKDLYATHPELTETSVNPSAWIQTYTGLKFFPQNPTMESISIVDIAHALSQQCRFTGHTSQHYSVAQHCVLVSYLCNVENQLHGLLHDASEFALTDIASPIKKLPELSGYRMLEKKVQQSIYRKFGLLEEEPLDVKRADLLVLAIEAQTFLAPIHPDWKMSAPILTLKIVPISPEEAERLFLDRFKELYKLI